VADDAGPGTAGNSHHPAEADQALPETPHELPIDRAKVDALLDRVRQGEAVDLLDEFLAAVDWRRGFADDEGESLALEDIARLMDYYRAKFADVGSLFLAELLSTEFMTEQRARGDVAFSEKLLALGRDDPALWTEIRAFFRRKEFATALLALAHGRRTAADG
jgi:hypothetical protein